MATLLDRGSTPLISTNIQAKARRYVFTGMATLLDRGSTPLISTILNIYASSIECLIIVLCF